MDGKKVSDPIYSHSGGFFRYNYEKQYLEFINQQTKTVAGTWAIPEDQWEALPSQEEYCRKITEEADKTVAQGQRQLRIKALVFVGVILLGIIGFIVMPHKMRKDAAISNAQYDYPGFSQYTHVDDYKGICIIRIGPEGSFLYYAYDSGHIYTAGSLAAMRDLLSKS